MGVEQRINPGYAVFAPDDLSEYKSGLFRKNLYHHLERAPGAKPVLIVPPLGNTEAGIAFFARRLGLYTLAEFKREFGGEKDSLLPSPVTDWTIAGGVKYAPETVCFPFKIALGSMISQLDEFKEVQRKLNGNFYSLIVTHQSSGYCRERCYAPLEELILRDLKEDFDFYSVHESIKGIWDLASTLSRLSGVNTWGIIDVLNETIERLDMIGRLEDRVRFAQSRIAPEDYHTAEEILNGAKYQVASVSVSTSELKAEFAQHLANVNRIKKDEKKIIFTVGLTGEIFDCEEFMRNSCHAIGREFLKRGVYFVREVGIDHYLSRFRLDPQRFLKYFWNQINPFKRDKRRENAVVAGFNEDAGGHYLDEGDLYGRQRKTKLYDGIVRIGPLNCGPMVAAESVMMKCLHPRQDEIEALEVGSDPGIGTPVLKIIIDELSGQAGIISRVEAFIDLMKFQFLRKQNSSVK